MKDCWPVAQVVLLVSTTDCDSVGQGAEPCLSFNCLCGPVERIPACPAGDSGAIPGVGVITEIKEVELGEDIKEMVTKNVDIHNVSGIDINTLDDDECYLVTKHVGFYPKCNKSGLFILSLILITEEFIEKSFS